MKWTGEDTMKCLDLYARNSCLWDFNDANFRNKVKRAAALEFIFKELNVVGMSMDDLKTKIHSIRNTYTNELRKIEKSKKAASGTDDIYSPRLPWFKLADSFLRKVVTKRKRLSKLEHKDMSQDVLDDTAEVNIIHEAVYSSPTDDDSESVTSVSSHDSVVRSKCLMQPIKRFRGEKRKGDYFMHFKDAVQALRAIAATKKEDDEIDSFTKSISAQMRKLPEEHVICLMSEIQSLVSAKRAEDLAAMKKLLHQ